MFAAGRLLPTSSRARLIAGRRCSGPDANRNTVARAVPLPELLDVATIAAKAGAEVVMDAVDKPRTISFKGATDLVTETDVKTEAAVLEVLRKAFPKHAVLGEEGGVSGDTSSDYLWCVDPLDGTTNFAHAYPSFAVSVGCMHKGVPVAGCVIEFTGGPGVWATRTFTAHTDSGTRMNGKPVSVSTVEDVRRSLLVTGFGYDHDAAWAANVELFKEFTDVAQGVRRLGAAAVDLCHLSMGVVDSYWEYRLKPWDVTAGIVIAQEAGAKITTMDGQPYTVFHRSMCASNGKLHDQILAKTDPHTRRLKGMGIDLGPALVPPGYERFLP